MDNATVYTASEARDNLYSLIRKASNGAKTFEIRLRGVDPVMVIGKNELESWFETLDILSNKEELDAIKKAKKQKGLVSHQEMLKEIGLK